MLSCRPPHGMQCNGMHLPLSPPATPSSPPFPYLAPHRRRRRYRHHAMPQLELERLQGQVAVQREEAAAAEEQLGAVRRQLAAAEERLSGAAREAAAVPGLQQRREELEEQAKRSMGAAAAAEVEVRHRAPT